TNVRLSDLLHCPFLPKAIPSQGVIPQPPLSLLDNRALDCAVFNQNLTGRRTLDVFPESRDVTPRHLRTMRESFIGTALQCHVRSLCLLPTLPKARNCCFLTDHCAWFGDDGTDTQCTTEVWEHPYVVCYGLVGDV